MENDASKYDFQEKIENRDTFEEPMFKTVKQFHVPLQNIPDNIQCLNKPVVTGEPNTEDEQTVVTKAEKNQVIEETSFSDQMIFKALQKVKALFFSSQLNEHKLAEFLYRMLSLTDNDEVKMNSGFIDDIVNEMLNGDNGEDEIESFNRVIDKLMGEDSALNNTLSTEKVDEIVEKLLGEDTKKLICEKLSSDNLDELLNKLVDEKLNIESDPCVLHPVFDEFIEKILRKDVEDFIKKRFDSVKVPNSDTVEIAEIKYYD